MSLILKRNWYDKFASVLVLVIIIVMFVPTLDLEARKPAGPGRYSFEAAYRNEKANPEKAARLYNKALREGLNAELRKAANWRLFYLYRDIGAYHSALRVLPRIASGSKRDKLKDSLVSKAARRLQVDRETARYYIKGLASLASNTAGSNEDGLNYFGQAMRRSPGSVALQNAIRKASEDAGISSQALSLYASGSSQDPDPDSNDTNSQSACEGLDCDITRAQLLISSGRLSEARRELRKLSEASGLSQTQKVKILYLFGTQARQSGDAEIAQRYYRLAMRYGDAQGKQRMRVLSSFGLYQKGYKKQARIMLGDLSRAEQSKYFSVQVYYLLLRAEVDRDNASHRRLVGMKAEIQRRYEKGYARSLMKAALDYLK